MRKVAPYGGWPSPVTTELMTGQTIGLSALTADGDALYWLESRPSEAGRSTLMRWMAGQMTELTPLPCDVGTRVHEYGGGAYAVDRGRVIFSDRREAGVWLVDADGELRLVTQAEGCRYADFAFDRQRNRVIAVREDHRQRPPSDPLNTIVALDLDEGHDSAANEGTVLVEGADFVASPRLASDGSRLLWLQWQHPDMPWDATRLYIAQLDEAGLPVSSNLIVGAEAEAVVQPEWTGDSVYFLSDRSGWWNLYQWRNGEIISVAPVGREIGGPAWQFAAQHYVRLSDDKIIAAMIEDGVRQAVMLDGDQWRKIPIGSVAQVPIAFGAGLAAIVTSVDRLPEIVLFQAIESDGGTVIRAAGENMLAADDISIGEAIDYPTAGGIVSHAIFYAPRSGRFEGPADARPPLVVLSHGGPTSMAYRNFSLAIQWWTSRGIAVVDVNYRGSSGYGRAYRQMLNGAWGVADVEDCIAAVGHLVTAGLVDGERVAIRGGSAGGFTVLSALTRSDVFKAGASLYGVADLMMLAEDTHKFEARYLDRLIGPLPETAALYRERSPLNHVDEIAVPVIFFQGADDRVVPPNQADAMVDAMLKNQLPVAHYVFPGEGHGFRQAETIRRALELELDFYAQIFGFTAAGLTQKAEIRNWPRRL